MTENCADFRGFHRIERVSGVFVAHLYVSYVQGRSSQPLARPDHWISIGFIKGFQGFPGVPLGQRVEKGRYVNSTHLPRIRYFSNEFARIPWNSIGLV